jgi:alpha-galactosidase
MSRREEIKIAYVGGGSRQWAPKLMTDLALASEITGDLVLYDIDYEAAVANIRVGNMIFGQDDAETSFNVTAEKRAEDALEGADFIVMSIEPGPTEMRYADLEIPRKYGILQTVGDSTGPGGITRAMRTMPIYIDYAHKIMEYCPEAWVINYTNPMTLCVASLYAAEPNIKAFGCCHEVFNTQEILTELVEKWFSVERPKRNDIKLDIAGVNHFTLATAASWNGIDLFPRLKEMISEEDFFRSYAEEARERIKNERWFESERRVAFDFLRNYGVLGAAGDRHLVEFVPWYLNSEETLHDFGVIITPYQWRIKIAKQKRKQAGTYEVKKLMPSGEEGVQQMLALLGIRDLDTNVNIPNVGQMLSTPLGAVVETYAQFRRDSVKPVVADPLPRPMNNVVRNIIEVQEMCLEGALKKDKDIIFQAMLNDPLVRIRPDAARKMFDEMVNYTTSMLKYWK